MFYFSMFFSIPIPFFFKLLVNILTQQEPGECKERPWVFIAGVDMFVNIYFFCRHLVISVLYYGNINYVTCLDGWHSTSIFIKSIKHPTKPFGQPVWIDRGWEEGRFWHYSWYSLLTLADHIKKKLLKIGNKPYSVMIAQHSQYTDCSLASKSGLLRP